ncbi:MAG: prolipoprotein diacylglyceryl transferase [Salinivirgaceae bacterium]|nr:prolipoprotein diacylglyceryl transferase [Salinivirgaceae bacterium]
MNLLSILWNPDPVWFTIGSVSFRYYSILYVAGLVAAYFIINKLVMREGKPREFIDKFTWFIIIGLIIGARIGHCLFYEPGYYIHHIAEMLFPIKETANGWKFIGYQGLASHGGAIGILIALYLFCRHYKVDYLWMADRLVMPVPLVGVFIRFGNFMNSEIVGRPTGSDWGIIFQRVDTLPRHPSQLYEAICYLIIFGIVLWYYHKNYGNLVNGKIFGLFLMLIFMSRFIIEFGKEVQEEFEEAMLLDMGQLLSLPFIALGIWLFFFRKPKSDAKPAANIKKTTTKK